MIFRALALLLQDEEGQATTEYVMMLSIVTIFLVMTIKNLIQPLFAQLNQYISNSIGTRFFGSNLHYFRVQR